MVCPQCRQEYGEEIPACPKCGVALVGELPAEVREEPEWADLVVLHTTADEAEILVAKSLLEAEGIRCFLEGEGIQELMGAGRAGLPVRIQVEARDAEAARELLAANDLAFTGPDERGEPGSDREE